MEITIFELTGCPYCAWERKIMGELSHDPKYAGIKVDRILEDEHPDIAEKYDYYYVPTIYLGDKKLMEADPKWDQKEMRKHIESALSDLI